MIDYNKQLVSTLEKILPTHYELVLTNKTKTPCISYQERNNYSLVAGDTREYSKLSYTIKVWDTDLENIQKYSQEIDKALRVLGFKRVSSGELADTNSAMIQKIMTYEALGLENY